MTSKLSLNSTEIKKIIPHRYPLLMIDYVVDLKPMEYCIAIKNTSINEEYFNGHYPEIPLFPGVYQIEAAAQTGGIAISYGKKNIGVPVLARVKDAKFRLPITAGQTLLIESKIINFKMNVVNVKCTISTVSYHLKHEIVSNIELVLVLTNLHV